MKKVLLIAGILILLALIGFIVYRASVSPFGFVDVEKYKNSTILFYGDGCPHCKNVDDYISQNGIEQKVQFQRMEVWNSQENAQVLASLAKICGISSDALGVPFLWDGLGTKCYSGDVDIINYFKEKAGI
jgi:hypothetical protein